MQADTERLIITSRTLQLLERISTVLGDDWNDPDRELQVCGIQTSIATRWPSTGT